MRTKPLSVIVCTLLLVWISGIQDTAEAAKESLDDGAVDDLNRISSYLNGIETLEGSFLQVASNGAQDRGKFYMKRPGKLRFEYDDTNPITIISDGTWVTLTNRKLKTVDRYPLSATPLKLLLKKNVNLKKDADIVEVAKTPGRLAVTAREGKGRTEGKLTIMFSDPGLELMQWIITDAQGFTTTIALRDLRRDTKISPALFIAKDVSPFDRNR